MAPYFTPAGGSDAADPLFGQLLFTLINVRIRFRKSAKDYVG
jgi:hypothetical protein